MRTVRHAGMVGNARFETAGTEGAADVHIAAGFDIKSAELADLNLLITITSHDQRICTGLSFHRNSVNFYHREHRAHRDKLKLLSVRLTVFDFSVGSASSVVIIFQKKLPLTFRITARYFQLQPSQPLLQRRP